MEKNFRTNNLEQVEAHLKDITDVNLDNKVLIVVAEADADELEKAGMGCKIVCNYTQPKEVFLAYMQITRALSAQIKNMDTELPGHDNMSELLKGVLSVVE